ncbi:MAG TPA: RIP metalloprotease RseP [Verrucomicrobiae bacterium]|nr:RIP metalloprotease RseP [Verrucomicrobiae bacterium]
MTILHYIFIALEVILLFNLLIGVHELGHFLAAKWRGLKIERFAIWFGKPIWKKEINGVEYALGWIPAGGYVALPQMATMEAIEGKNETPAEQLPNVSPFDKIIVAFAGPLFSFLLAFAFAFLVWGVGRPSNDTDNSTQIGWVYPNGPAAQAGLQAGDIILAVDGHPVHHFLPSSSLSDSVKWRIVTSTGTNIAITYLRDGQKATAYVVPTNPPTPWYERKALRQISMDNAEKFTIAEIASNSPADLAGLKPGDEIIAMNGTNIYSPAALIYAEDQLTNEPNLPMTFTIRRGGEQFKKTLLAVKPLQPKNAGPSYGIVSYLGDTNVSLDYPSPLQQIETSAGQVFTTIGALFARHSEIGVQQLGGAVMILRVYSNLFDDPDGWRRVLWFSVILNVNLALLNLLPLPMLDGGHILLALIEWIRRRPSNAIVLNYVQNGFAILLISFMLYIAFFDIGDWVRSTDSDRDAPVVFAPPK